MNLYALQVKTRTEKRFISLFRALHPENSIPIHFPQRQLSLRKNGVIKKTLLGVFPGYLFLEAANSNQIKASLLEFRQIDGFYRFLKSNNDITPLSNRDLELVLHFINSDNPAGLSKVYFDDNSRIIILEGPLCGLEGRILKVDKRKGRAKVKLDLYDDSFSIDLAFEVISKTQP